MAEREERRRTIRQHDLFHEGFEVGLVLGKVVDMTPALVAQLVLGQALSAPIESGDGEAPPARVLDDLEILLDELGAAVEQAQRALAARRWCKPREAQLHPVRGLEGSGDRGRGGAALRAVCTTAGPQGHAVP